MKTSRQEIQEYFESIFGVKPKIRGWKKTTGLPFFLVSEYTFETVTLYGQQCLVLLGNEPFENASKIRKHMDTLKSLVDCPVLYATGALKSFERKRLMESGVQFVVPGNQLFAPQLGMDLREFYRSRVSDRASLGPASQALLIAAIVRGWDKEYAFRGMDLAHGDVYSKMTLSRAIKEFHSFGLIEPTKNGTTSRWRFAGAPRVIWEKALPVLQSPVKRVIYSRFTPVISQAAGLSALSKESLIEEPALPIVAFSKEEWDVETKRSGHKDVSKFNDPAFEVQIWGYSPDQICGENSISVSKQRVDLLSLYLSLRDDTDERIQICLDEMMGKIEW